MVSEGTASPGISSVVTRTAFNRHAREPVHRADAFDLRINFFEGATGPGRAKLNVSRCHGCAPSPNRSRPQCVLAPRVQVFPATSGGREQRKGSASAAGKGPGMFANVQSPQPPGKIQDEFIRSVGKAKAPPRDLASVLAALFAGGKSGRRYRARCPRVGVSPGGVSGMSRPGLFQDKAV